MLLYMPTLSTLRASFMTLYCIMIGTWSGNKSADSHLTPEVCPFSDKIACLHQKGIANGLSYQRKDVF